MEISPFNRPSSPAFRTRKGMVYTAENFNDDLKKLLGPHIKYRKLTGHSFRAGLATLMAQAGFEDKDIQSVGRWSSESFKRYIKLPRLIRVKMAKKIGKFLQNI